MQPEPHKLTELGVTPGPATNHILIATVKQSTDEQKLNKLERAWLAVMRQRNYAEIGIQSITLKIGNDTRYTPDFSAVVDGVFTFFETKGFFRDDAKVKIKVTARQFRWARFVLVEKTKGQWKEAEIKP